MAPSKYSMFRPVRERPRLSAVAVVGFALAILAVVLLLLAGPGSQWGWWHFRTGFRMLRWGAYAGIAAAVVSLIAAVLTRPGTARKGLVLALLGLVIGIAAVVIPWRWQQTARAAPPIHDITTDPNNPPEFAAILPLRANAPNPPEYAGPETAARQQEAYPDIRPVHLALPPDQAFQRALQTAQDMGWEIVAVDPVNGRVEATDRTFWFGFADDVVVRVTPTAEGSRIDARSKSRVGRGDAGANARRLRSYLTRIQQR